ncbi:MAG: hypothetical protein ABR549_04020 [Mycobacteriales bacterium]
MSTRRPRTPNLDQLQLVKRSDLLGELLATHPELLTEAEALARDHLATEDADSVARDVEVALRGLDTAHVAYRAGRVYGRGYIHENEAAAELLEEALEPYLSDVTRRAGLGLTEAAGAIGLGLLQGLARCESKVPDGSVLAYAGPDVPGELAWSVCKTLKDAGVSLADDAFGALPEGWGQHL